MFQEHRITLRSGVDYNSSISPEVGFNIIGDLVRLMVSCPNEWVLDNTKQWLIGFLGRLLIGGNAYKEFVSLLGEKDSGKTTLVGILKDIMGSYCGVVKDEILQGSDTDSINRSLYVLKDKRLLVHSEGTNQKKVNTVTLKRITGDSLIPLGNQDYSFTIKGKIVEDTNYAPVPDNPTDEAFNKRAIIIPFQKNTTVNKATIDNIINQAKDNKEAIFVAMVHAATFGMGDAQKVNPWVSEQVKNCLSILRDLETVFYNNICETNLTDNVTVLGSRLHKAFQEWIDKCIIPALKMMPYLSSEKIKFPSEREFHDKMKKLHTSYDTHSREGLRYRKLFVHEDRIYWDSRLFWKETNPLLDIKRNEAREAEKNRKMMESFNNKEVLNDKLESSISRDNNAVQGINKHSPKQARDAQMAMRPFQMPPFNMGAGMWTPPFPLNAPLYPQMPQEGSPSPLFKPKRQNL
jgi:phage/plasmid-associated DNA primase